LKKILFNIYSGLVYFVSRTIFKITLNLFFKFKVIGKENIPAKGSFIIATNHASYMDPPVIGAALRKRLRFVTSDHLYNKKFALLWYEAMGCIKVKRDEPDHRAIKKMLNCLKRGEPVGIFPEGTRSEDGRVQEPQLGIGFLALKSQSPVLPCFIKGTSKALPKGSKDFASSAVSIYIGKPIETREFKYEGDKKEGYRLFAKKIMHNIAQLEKRYAN